MHLSQNRDSSVLAKFFYSLLKKTEMLFLSIRPVTSERVSKWH